MVYQVTGSGVSLGFATALRTIPSLCMSPLAGVLADRYDRRRLLQISHFIKILLTAIFWAVTTHSDPGTATLYGLILLLGVITTFDAPIRRGFVRVIVPASLLTKAASLHTAVISVGRILGPAIGGILISLFGTPACFLANTTCALLGFLLLYRIKPMDFKGRASSTESYTFRTALSYTWRTEQIRVILFYLGITCITILNIEVILPILVDERLGGGSGTFSMLLIFLSLGTLLGSLGAAEQQRSGVSFHKILFGLSMATVLLSYAPNKLLVLLGLIFLGTLSGVFLGRANAMVQANVAPEFHGRVVAIYAMIFVGMRSIGSLLVGALAQIYSAPWALRITAVSNIILVAIVAGRLRFAKRINADHQSRKMKTYPE